MTPDRIEAILAFILYGIIVLGGLAWVAGALFLQWERSRRSDSNERKK